MPRRRGADQRNLVIASISSPPERGISPHLECARMPRSTSCASACGTPAMTSEKRLVISLVVTALALAGPWFRHFYFIMCCAPPPPR
jgi:hypothetical protein